MNALNALQNSTMDVEIVYEEQLEQLEPLDESKHYNTNELLKEINRLRKEINRLRK